MRHFTVKVEHWASGGSSSAAQCSSHAPKPSSNVFMMPTLTAKLHLIELVGIDAQFTDTTKTPGTKKKGHNRLFNTKPPALGQCSSCALYFLYFESLWALVNGRLPLRPTERDRENLSYVKMIMFWTESWWFQPGHTMASVAT